MQRTGGWASHHRTGLVSPAIVDSRLSKNQSTLECAAKVLDRSRIDFGIVRKWITECLVCYEECVGHEDSTSAFELIVIDCQIGNLIKKPDGSTYVALSYVWGPTGQKTSANPATASLLDTKSIPRTVRDAMKVTLDLGYRFLWVDRFCINQSNPQEKHDIISRMDQIYENAVVTIIAAAGKDANFGLPGAGTLPLVSRNYQPAVKFGPYKLTTTLPEIDFELEKSVWATRGWTYQEAILYRRCLVFTPAQVFLVCKNSSQSETLPFMRKEWRPKTNLIRNLSWTNAERQDRPQMTLQSYINSYLNRHLTFDSDALNAFRGISEKHEWWIYWGIPLVPQHGCNLTKDAKDRDDADSAAVFAFLRGLSWHPDETDRCLRVGCLPTWSWVKMKRCNVKFCHDPQDFQLSGDVYVPYKEYLLSHSCDVKVSLPCLEVSIEGHGGWISLADSWRKSSSKVIPEH